MTSSNGNFSALLTLCSGKIHRSPVNRESPLLPPPPPPPPPPPHTHTQRPVTWGFVFSWIWAWINRCKKQLWGWWFETPSRSLWRHCNGVFHQHRPYLQVLVVSTGQPLIRSVILYSCISNIQENDTKLYMVINSTICASHSINCISTLLMVLQMWI